MKRISFFSRLLNLIAPQYCYVCGTPLSISEEILCGVCNMKLPRTGFAACPEDNEMVRMLWGRLYDKEKGTNLAEKATALFRFEPDSQVSRLIYQLKYKYHPEIGELLGRMTAKEQSEEFFQDIDVIVPVPLTPRRQRQRGYNQSMMIAQGVSKVTGIPIAKHVIKRIAFQESQTKKNWWERQTNVEGAFELVQPQAITGKHILVIDDVMTTGSTILSCCEALRQAEGVRFSILTIGFTKL